MRRLLIALGATLFMAAAPAEPPERWIPLPSNPALEIFGREDSTGRFRYSQMRKRETPGPVLNYGVSLPTLAQPREVMAPDAASAGLVYRAIRGEGEELGSAADCDDGQCDVRRRPPKPPDLPSVDWLHPAPEHLAAMAFAVAVVVIVGLLAFIAVAFLIKTAANLFRKE